MSANTPPDPYFNGINFNPSFFQTVIEYLTIPIANTRYLLLNGLNYMTGNLGIKRVAGVELDVNGKAYIDNGITGVPAVGQYGGVGTRLILYQGTLVDTPVALGVDGTSLWYGSYSAGSHIFNTGIKERLRILSSGNVGIGTSGASSLLHLHIQDLNQEVAIRFTDTGTGSGATDGCAVYKSTNNNLILNNFENSNILFNTSNTEKMRISNSGNIGIGTTTTPAKVNIYGTVQLESKLNLTGQEFLSPSFTSTDGIAFLLGVNRANNRNMWLADTAKLAVNATNPTLTLSPYGFIGSYATDGTTKLPLVLNNTNYFMGNGRVGISTDNPGNIFQVGDGGRLRISNGTNDYTLLGTKETDDINNTRIVLSGFQRTNFNGNIEYYVITSTGAHKFNIDNVNKLEINGTNAIFNNNIIVGNVNTGNPNIQIGTGTDNIGISRPSAGGLSSSAAIGDMVIRASNKLFLQSGTGFSAMCINTNNNIQLGYGYTTATFPITLNSTNFTNQSFTGYTSGIASGISTSSSFANPGIYIGIMNTTAFSVGFYIYSDKRIKKDFEPIDNSLEIIEKINLTTFKYIDYIKKGNKKNYGVIAQEIEKIVPEVINECKDYIPDIYKNANGYDGNNTIYIKVDNLIIGDKIRIYDNKNKEHHKEIINISEDYITIDEPIEDYEDGSDLFIYGKEIPDLKNVNYEALFIVNMRATQELYKRVKALEKYLNILY